jgi:formylglycine-generating enzyme required for sulfatase activity
MSCLTIGVLSSSQVAGDAPADEAKTFVERIPGTTVSIEMVRIPEGQTKDGDPIGGFLMGTTEVTWDAFDVLLFEQVEAEEDAAGEPEHDAFARPSKPYVAVDRGFGHNGNPAISMSFKGAKSFCAWLSMKTGRSYRLPTEAEWEYAALAGSDGHYCFGDDEAALDRYAWFKDNAKSKTHPVATKEPNAWGLYDMHGNAGEWCVRAGEDGKRRGLLRGGSYIDNAQRVRAAAIKKPRTSWNMSDPNIPKSPWWYADGPFVGMRIVCDDTPPE